MNNNDVLKRLRYALNIADVRVVELFKLVGYEIPKGELESIFKTEGEAGYVECGDELAGKFLDGLVLSRRGARPEPADDGAGVGVGGKGARGAGAKGAGATAARGAGAKGAGTARAPEVARPPRLGNNEILKRVRIALSLKDDDIVEIMGLAGVGASKSELSALFRKRGHPNYRPCGDQFLRNFLVGLTAKYRV